MRIAVKTFFFFFFNRASVGRSGFINNKIIKELYSKERNYYSHIMILSFSFVRWQIVFLNKYVSVIGTRAKGEEKGALGGNMEKDRGWKR